MADRIVKLNNTTFQFENMGDQNDKIRIGGDTPDFKPEVLLQKWGDECWVKLGLSTTKNIVPIETTDKIIWKEIDKEIEFYKQKGAEDIDEFETNIILKSRPISPFIEMDFSSHNVDLQYQGEVSDVLAQGRLDYANKARQETRPQNIILKDWQDYMDWLPETLEESRRSIRPEKILDSFALYRKDDNAIRYNEFGADKYKAGKVGHIYYPYLEDSNGWKVRAKSFTIENGKLISEMPNGFWKDIVLPGHFKSIYNLLADNAY